jgi:hypothetical protein
MDCAVAHLQEIDMSRDDFFFGIGNLRLLPLVAGGVEIGNLILLLLQRLDQRSDDFGVVQRTTVRS